jgi:hypothetical protein
MCHVAVADQSAALARELEAAARRLEHMRATPGAGGSPGLAPLLARLAAWRPARDRHRGGNDGGERRWVAANDNGGGVENAGVVVEGGEGEGAADAGGWAEGQRRGWRRGWRKNKQHGVGAGAGAGGGGGGPASSLPAMGNGAAAGPGAALAAPPALGVQTAFGRLPTGPFFTELGRGLLYTCCIQSLTLSA